MKIVSDIKNEFAAEPDIEFNQVLDDVLVRLMEDDDLNEPVEEKENVEEIEENSKPDKKGFTHSIKTVAYLNFSKKCL